MGLALVRSIVEAHGGQAIAQPRDEGGLAMRVKLARGTAER